MNNNTPPVVTEGCEHYREESQRHLTLALPKKYYDIFLMTPNKELFLELMKECERQGLSDIRKYRYALVFKKTIELRIDMERLTQECIDRFFFYVKTCNKADSTKTTEWKVFKKIARWMRPELRYNYVLKERPKIINILTMEEIDGMVEKSRSLRNRILIALLYESGCRIGELLNIKKNDISFDECGALIVLNGKTGIRTVRVVKCVGMLSAFVGSNPASRTDGKLFDMSEQMANNKIIKKAAKRAGIDKRVYPHLFRHTRATHLAKHLTETEMRVFFGWAKGSKMVDTYVHLTCKDVNEKILRIS